MSASACRSLALAAALALSALALLGPAPWNGSAGADAPQVTLVSPGGGQHTLSLAALSGAVEHSYAVRSNAGSASQTVSGFPLAALLEAAGLDPFGFSYLEVERPAGGAVLLSRRQALDPGAFPEGPPLIYATAAGTAFLRPSAGAEDANAADCFEAPQGLTIELRRGSPLLVRASASPRRTEPGRPVHFAATVERAGSGEALTYSWYFDDGHSASGASAVHGFSRPGSYDVVVGVTTAGEDTGSSAVVTVQVGAAPGGGPDRRGGGRNRAAGAPDHGAAAGPAGPAAPAGSPSAGSGASAGSGGSPGETAASAAPRRSARPRPPKASGERVVGRLLGTSTPLVPAPAARARSAPAARTGTLADGGPGGGGVPAAAWGGAAVLALLGLGALREAGSLGDRLPWHGGGWR